jgi:large subunit ribosomal protein L10
MRLERTILLNQIVGMLSNSDFTYLTTYKGMSVAELTEIRGKLLEHSSEFHVVKNSYVKKTAENLGLDISALDTKGDTAIVIGSGDCCAVAKVLKSYAKTNKKLSMKGGLLNNKVLTSSEVEELAELPSLDVMRAMLLGTLQAPKQKIVGVLNSKISSIVYAIKAYLDKKEQVS